MNILFSVLRYEWGSNHSFPNALLKPSGSGPGQRILTPLLLCPLVTRQLQCEVPCGVGNIVNSSLFINSSLSSLSSTSHAVHRGEPVQRGGGSGRGRGRGGGGRGGGRGHFIHPAIYGTTTWCFAPMGLRTIRKRVAANDPAVSAQPWWREGCGFVIWRELYQVPFKRRIFTEQWHHRPICAVRGCNAVPQRSVMKD